MTYHQFVNEVETKMQSFIAPNMKTCIHIALKNNGCERRGVMVSEEGINISPAIYLEEYYEQFQEGKELDQIVEQILELYKETRFHESWEGKCVHSFENVKPSVVYKVINRDENKELLQHVPHRNVLDLAVVCYVLLDLSKHRTAVMMVRDEHLAVWNVTEDEVFCEAEKNVVRLLPAKFSTMKDVVAHMLEIPAETDNGEDFMYVLSNEQKNFGAACIFYEGVAEMIGEKLGENYYVIPSSVHEVIIIPESRAPKKCEIEEMIAEINDTQLDTEEILSYKVYYYSGEEKRLIM